MTRKLRHARAVSRILTEHPYPNAQDCLRETLGRATPQDWQDGISWYRDAHHEAAALARDTQGLTPRRAAGIIAALSPQISWEQNLEIARTFTETGGRTSVHFALCEDRAREILQGADPADVLGGRKVRSFFLNIAYPDAPGPVTIDRHAIAILAGMTTPEFSRRHGRYLERYGAYRHAAGHYRHAARLYGVLPHELQAVAWLVHRATDPTTIDYGNF